MAIQTECPHCHKSYRLKDELAGKRVTCGNPDCRKPFTVDGKPAVNGSGRPPASKSAKPSRPAEPQFDVEAAAAAAFAEEGDQAAVPEDQRRISLTCTACDHKWDVPWSMQGKNVLCPECRTRQRVPEQKKAKAADWRDPNAGRPTLAKVEELEGAVGTVNVRQVSGGALKEAGVLTEEIEPRPRWHYVAWAGMALGLVCVVVFGVLYLIQTRREGARDDYMARAVQELKETAESPLPPTEAPLFRAALHIKAGEYAIRQAEDEARRAEAVEHFATARRELEAAPSSAGRDMLLAELAVAQVLLGGDDQQVAAGQRVRWTPAPAREARAKAEGKVYNVQEELRATFAALRKENKAASFEIRSHTARRVARELAKRGQPDLMTTILPQAFFDPEVVEITAQVALEAFKVTGNQDHARAAGEGLKGAFAADPKPSAPTAQTLWLVVDPPVSGVIAAPPPSPAGEVPDPTRQAYTALYLAQNKFDEALNLARRPGSLDARLAALALVAESAADPGPALAAAQEVLAGAGKSSPPDFTLTRLAAQAGRGNQPDKVDLFVKAVRDPGYRAWARGEALRQQLAATDKPAEEGQAEVPVDPKDYRVGQAWGRLAVARQTARVAGVDSATRARIETWGSGSFRPFGWAGLALGLQDRALR